MTGTPALYQHVAFSLGAQHPKQFPPDSGWEVAFIGRSNAGKSSAINALTGRRALARTSKTPGRTQQINFFDLDPEHRLVDLPGYGYARVTGEVRRQWQPLIEGYLQQRRSLRGLMLIADCRRNLTDLDRQLLLWCRSAAMPVHVLLTKSDKLKRGAAQDALRSWAAELHTDAESAGPGAERPTAQLFSSRTGAGIEAARSQLERWLEFRQKKSPS